MITRKTMQSYGCESLEEFIDKMCEWLIKGDDMVRLVGKLSPRQRVDALLYLNGSHMAEHLELSKMISQTIK